MRREGRQHGMVRTFIVSPSSRLRTINPTDSPSTAGLFTKVSTKPTNHSKFTGKCKRPKCNGCHDHPVTKSRHKSKGSHKRPTTRLEDHYDGVYTFAAERADNDYDNDYDSDVALDSAYDPPVPPQKSNELDETEINLIVSNEGSSEIIESLLITDGEDLTIFRGEDVEFVLAAAAAVAADEDEYDDEWYLV